jgi:O-antigen biosynthesis protein WbqP
MGRATFDFMGQALIVLAVPVLRVAAAVRLTSAGPALYWSDRVGRHNQLFEMPKFRSMRVGTPAVATHLLADPKSHLTPIGGFLRKSSLDELPQLSGRARRCLISMI